MTYSKGKWIFREQGEANQYFLLDASAQWLMAIQHNGHQTVTEQVNNLKLVTCSALMYEFIERLAAQDNKEAKDMLQFINLKQ